ncbi:MAG: RidA family protein [Alphaproteobacteria bacterium]|nr:RidA family protein [Alphaproteobacteria bacterium]
MRSMARKAARTRAKTKARATKKKSNKTKASLSTLRQSVNVPGAAALFPNYSTSVVVKPGRLLFISGQVATDENGKTVAPGDVVGQAEYVLQKIETILKFHGATAANVVQDHVYVTDRASHPLVLPVRLKHFPKDGPTSSFVEVASLKDPSWLIEIEVVAVLP